jgi:hypothetical protein
MINRSQTMNPYNLIFFFPQEKLNYTFHELHNSQSKEEKKILL